MTNGGPRHEPGHKKVGGPKPAPKSPKTSLRRRSLISKEVAAAKGR